MDIKLEDIYVYKSEPLELPEIQSSIAARDCCSAVQNPCSVDYVHDENVRLLCAYSSPSLGCLNKEAEKPKKNLQECCMQMNFGGHLGSLLSMYGCYQYHNKVGRTGIDNEAFDTEQDPYVAPTNAENSNASKCLGTNKETHVPQTECFWGYVFHIIFQKQFNFQLWECVPVRTWSYHIGRGQSKSLTMSVESIISINSLQPNQKIWTIEAIVLQQGTIETFNNVQNNGRIWKMILVDNMGTKIQAVMFNEAVRKFEGIF
ncbi:hypothetical protein F0562_018042 [Nyssa sinensis]|uniref:Replication factor A C-terminal domain-containing protein n=1 Tax=Nyssa sinensis TaxID=561372 RepID=A0A5J4Z866_9ASTE|nr:hypothetical protein F0562_018042 [Nyssa sinensis]